MADQRMYEEKNGGRRSAGDQSKAVLIRALSERHPDLSEHSADVSKMAELVARELDVPEDQLEPIRHAAELHDVGKVGIPDAILNKPSKLDAEEWAFMRRHTIIGERIIAGAPALAQVAAWCARATSAGTAPATRTGSRARNPDRLPDHRVCDAFDAMVSERPYKAAAARARRWRSYCAARHPVRSSRGRCVLRGHGGRARPRVIAAVSRPSGAARTRSG